jgi:hypothetical protein
MAAKQHRIEPKQSAREAVIKKLRSELQKGLDSGVSERSPAQILSDFRKRRAAA